MFGHSKEHQRKKTRFFWMSKNVARIKDEEICVQVEDGTEEEG